MSSVDNRIVKLKFDNSQFEANVSKSMSTLDKLKEKLNFKDSAKDIENLQTAVNKVDFSAMQSSLQFLEKRFSATGEFIYKIWDQITDKAINAFKRVESATIGQIKSGGWARALNIANAQFQTAGLGASWDAIKAAADYAVTDTAYGLDEAAKTASQLLASGVDYQEIIEETDEGGLTQMHKALRAISGVAAMTNSSYTDIAHTFARIAGQGRVMAVDLNSIATRGLNAAATLAKAMGTTEEAIRDMVSKGEISFMDFAMAMDEAYGEHAKQANETFSGAMSNMKAALSRIGAIFAQPVIDKTNRFFNAITGRIKGVQKALSDLKKEGKKEGELYVYAGFATHFAEAWDAAVTAAENFVNTINLDWINDVADTMDKAAIKMKSFFDWVNEGFAKNADETEEAEEKVEESLKNMVATQAEYQAAMTIMFKDKSLTGNKRVKWLEQQGLNPKRVQKYIDSVVAAGWNVKNASIKVQDSITETKKDIVSLGDEVSKLPKTFAEFDALGAGQEEFLKKYPELREAYRDTDNWLAKIAKREQEAKDLEKAYAAVTAEYRKLRGFDPKGSIGDFAEMGEKQKRDLFEKYPQLLKTFEDTLNERKRFEGIAKIAANISETIKNIGTNIKTVIRAAKNAFSEVFGIDKVLPGIVKFTDKINELTDALLITEGGESALKTGFEVFFTVIRGGISLFGRLIMKLMDFVIHVARIIKGADEARESTKKTNGIIESLWKIIKKTAESFKDLILNFGDFINMVKNTEGVKRLREAFAGLGRRFRKDIDPASDALADFADSYEGIKMEDIADGIGWVADKIAWLVEQIPKLLDIAQKAFDTVSKFVTDVWSKITGWFDGKDAGSIFDTIKDKIVGAWEYTDDIGEKIETFLGKVWDIIKKTLATFDIYSVGDAGKALALILGVISLIELISNMSSIVGTASGVLKSFDGFLKGLTKAFESFGKSLGIFAIASVFQSLAWLFVGIGAFLLVVTGIDSEALYRGAAIVTLVGIFMVALVGMLNKASSANIREMFGGVIFKGILGVAAIVVALAIAYRGLTIGIKQLVDSTVDLANNMSNIDKVDKSAILIINLIKTVAFTVAGLMVAAAIITIILKKIDAGTPEKQTSITGAFIGIAAMMVAMGLAIRFIVKGITGLAKAFKGYDAIKIAAVLSMVSSTLKTVFLSFGLALAVILVGLSKVMSAAGTTGQMWAGVFMLLVLFAGTAAIIAEIGILAGVARVSYDWNAILKTITLVSVVLLSIGGMVALIGVGARLMTSKVTDSLFDVALILGLVVIGVAIVISQLTGMVKAVSGLDAEQMTAVMILALGGIAIFMLSVIAILDMVISAMNKEDSKVTSADILIIAASLVVMASAFVVFAKAMEMLSDLNISSTAVILAGVFAGLIIILGILGKKSGTGNSMLKIGAAVAAIGAGFLLFGAGMFVLGKGIQVLSKGLGLLDKALKPMLVVKLVALLAAFAVVLIPLAKILAPIFETIGKVIGNFADMIKSGGSVLFAGLKTWIGAIPELLGSLIKDVGNIIGNVIKTIVEKLKSGINKVSEWYNNLPTEGKKKIVKVLGVLFTLLEALAPDVISATLRIIFKVLDSIAEQAEFIANRLIQFLVKVLMAFAQAITKNAHIIGNAAKAVLYAILAIVLEVLALVFDFMQDIPVLGQLIESLFGDPASSFRDAQKEISAHIGDIQDDTNSWIKSFERANKQYQNSITDSQGALTQLITESSVFKRFLGNSESALNSYAAANEKAGEAVEFGFGKKYSASAQTYAQSSKVVRKAYDEYQELTAKAAEEQKKQADLYHRYEAQREAVDILYNTVDPYEQGGTIRLDKANDLLERLGLELEEQKKKSDEAKAAAEEYAAANSDLIGSLIDLQNAERELNELQKLRVSDDNREALKNISDEFFRETGFDFDFNSIDQAQLDAMMRSSPELRQMYSEQLKNIVKDRKERQEELAKSLVDGYRETQADVCGAMGVAIQGAIDNIKAQMDAEYIPAMELNGVQLMTGFISGAASQQTNLQDSTKSTLKTGIVDTAKAYLGISNGTSTVTEPQGENIIQGIIDGGNEKLPDLTTAVQNIMQSGVIDTTNTTLGIESPSKVMAKSGKFSILGLIQGLTDNAASLNTTSEQIGDAMIVSFGQPFERIAQMASGAIPYNPSITPVLDSSTMASDIYGLNSMFQGQTVSLDGYTGRLAADISGVQNQNEAIVDQLRELRMDMNEMTETILGMQIVLDSGTVIGELSDGMDYSLGVSSIRKKRGN